MVALTSSDLFFAELFALAILQYHLRLLNKRLENMAKERVFYLDLGEILSGRSTPPSLGIGAGGLVALPLLCQQKRGFRGRS